MRFMEQKEIKTMEQLADFPTLLEDMLIQILVNLPVRSLVRLKCVSKSWYHLIKSPMFNNKHFHTSRRTDSVLLVRRYLPPSEDLDVLSLHDMNSPDLDQVGPNLSIPFLKDLRFKYNRPYFPEGVTLLGPCNGLLLVCYGAFIILCCPTLREFKPLHPCPFACPNGFVDNILGSGFGCTSMTDFKILVIRSVWFDDVYDLRTYTIVHLYNSNNNSWRIMKDAITSIKDVFNYPGSEPFFNGNCHWNAEYSDDSSTKVILTFNVNTDTFGQFDYPDASEELRESNPYFTIIKNCFSIIQYVDSKAEPQILQIWVMKRYGFSNSWTKMYVLGPHQVKCCLVPWKNDEWVLTESTPGQLASFAIHTNEFMRFQVSGVEKTMRAVIYKESLISLNQILQEKPKCKESVYSG